MGLSYGRALAAALLAACCVLAGCTTYVPQSFWEMSKAKTVLEADNYRVEKLGVQATAACPYLFALDTSIASVGIPLGDPALLKKAMEDFHRQAKIEGRPAFLHNINVEWTGRGIPLLLVTKRVTITADVYCFTGEYVDYGTR